MKTGKKERLRGAKCFVMSFVSRETSQNRRQNEDKEKKHMKACSILFLS